TYLYSQRDGTPAAKMKDNVPTDVKKDRLQRLNKKVGQYSEKAMQNYEGTSCYCFMTYLYSQRDGTPAAKMKDNVPTDVKKDRLQRLNK
ncbi:hypothetical protein F1713_12385, partial [Streptococcus pneumoniae]